MKHIVVVGAGIAGLTAAAYLSQKHEVTLLEKADELGGLIGSFSRDGIVFDKGIRAVENSGTVLPMLRDLGIELNWKKSEVSIGFENNFATLSGEDSIEKYQKLLCTQFPDEIEAIDQIVKRINKITKYMQVLYGIDNPMFLDPKKEYKYFLKTIIPWMFKYSVTVKKIDKLKMSLNTYLSDITPNKELIDMISQKFFDSTPTFFGLSYFSMLNDYYYPVGGMRSLVEGLKDYILKHNGKILTNHEVISMDANNHLVRVGKEEFKYDKAVWAGDLKTMYKCIDSPLNKIALKKKEEVEKCRGNNSLFISYLSTGLSVEYFKNKCSPHCFYTPHASGLHSLSISRKEVVKHLKSLPKNQQKASLYKWLKEFLHKQTFEIGIPVLQDSALAPKGKSGIIVSFLFDYSLMKYIKELGIYEECKLWIQSEIVELLDESHFTGLKKSLIDVSSSTPLTIERKFNNSEGSTTGWSFSRDMPVETRLWKIAKSIKTPFKDIYQASHWSFSPSGVPTSIINAKIVANKIK